MWRDASSDNGEVRREVDEPKPGERLDRDSLQIREFTSLLRNRLSTQVKIRHKSNGGHIEIQYYSNDDLERLLDLILAE